MTQSTSVFETILAATGTAHNMDAPVITAARLARLQGAQLHLAHAVPLVSVRDTDGRPAASESSSVTARSLLSLYADRFPELTADHIMIAAGVAWEVIFRTALDLKSDLIVVGPHVRVTGGKSIPEVKGMLGSTADGVIRQARCPVMIANGDFPDDLLGFKRILVGMDFSPSCAVAICLAALLSNHCGAHISIFHMLPISPYPKYTPQALQADRMRLLKRMKVTCRRLLEGIDHQFYLKPGARPHEELLRFASQSEADVIVLGSHTKAEAGKWYSGSVVQRVALQASCPVIVVNGLEALTPWKDVPFVSRRFSSAGPPAPRSPQ